MSKQIWGTAVAAIFATAMVGAQGTPQGQQEQQSAAGQQPSVTLEGCLQQEPRPRQDMEQAAMIADGRFILENAQLKTGAAGAVGTSGETAARTESGARPDAASERSAASDRSADAPVGTSGTAAATSTAGAASYKLRGLDDAQMREHAGQRVQLQGHVVTSAPGAVGGGVTERSDADQRDADRPSDAGAAGAVTQPSGASGAGIAGHGAAGATAPGADPAQDHSRMATAGDMKEFHVTSIQRISGDCQPASR